MASFDYDVVIIGSGFGGSVAALVVVVRDGKNLKRRALGLARRTLGRRVLERAFENPVEAIEARNGAARERAA